jgi:hypothetical protein
VEIHAPDKPIHSLKDLSIHLATITAGTLIALSLEGILEWNHHRNLVREAKENIIIELAGNKRAVEKSLQSLPERVKNYRNALNFANDRLERKHTNINEMMIGFMVPSVSAVAWKTAETTGALGHMKYAEVQKYAEVYDVQDLYVRAEAQKLQRVSQVEAILMGGDPNEANLKDIESFRQQILVSLADLTTEEHLAKTLSEAHGKLLSEKQP